MACTIARQMLHDISKYVAICHLHVIHSVKSFCALIW